MRLFGPTRQALDAWCLSLGNSSCTSDGPRFLCYSEPLRFDYAHYGGRVFGTVVLFVLSFTRSQGAVNLLLTAGGSFEQQMRRPCPAF